MSLNTTPVGFVLLVAAVVHLIQPTEIVFRAVPLGFGLATLPLGYALARRLYDRRLEASLAVFLLATNLVFVTYCRTLKPYTADMFSAVLLLLLTVWLCDRPSAGRWMLFGLALISAPLLSFGSLLVIPVASGYVLLHAVHHRMERHAMVLPWCAVHAAFAGVLALNWSIYLRHQRSGSLLAYWRNGFPPHGPSLEVLSWYGTTTVHVTQYLFAPLSPQLALGLQAALCGGLVTALTRRDQRRIALLAAGPLLLAAVAALFHLYPYGGITGGGRILLVTLPGLILLVAGALASGLRLTTHSPGLAVVAALLLVVAFAPVKDTIAYSTTSVHRAMPGDPWEETRGLIQDSLLPALQPRDEIFVYYGVTPAFQVYAPRFRTPYVVTPPLKIVRADRVTAAFGGYSWDVTGTAAKLHPRRIWLLISHAKPSIRAWLIGTVLSLGPCDLARHATGADLYRVRPTAGGRTMTSRGGEEARGSSAATCG